MTAVATTARDRARLIREGLTAVWDLLTAAYDAEDWKTLGYSSWEAYCTGEFRGQIPRLGKGERGGVVQGLAEHGMPIKAIAAATGIARNTIRRDLRPEPEGGQIDPSAEQPRMSREQWADEIKGSLRRAFGPLMSRVDEVRALRSHLVFARDHHPDPDVVADAVGVLRLIEHEDGTLITDAEHYAGLMHLASQGTADPEIYYAYLRDHRHNI